MTHEKVNSDPRLDEATKLDISVRITFRPTVGEHAVQVIRAAKCNETESEDRLPDPERSRREAQRRAGIQLRRFCVHHKIWRMTTLTFADAGIAQDLDQVVRHIRAFFRGLRKQSPGIHYVYAIEAHPGGHGFHVHVGLSRFLSKMTIRALWNHGFIDVRSLRGKAESNTRQGARQAARYLAKYATKAENEGRQVGSHRYERSQSGPVPEETIECDSWQAAIDYVRLRCRVTPWEWWSDTVDDGSWLAPRTVIFRE